MNLGNEDWQFDEQYMISNRLMAIRHKEVLIFIFLHDSRFAFVSANEECWRETSLGWN